LFDVELGGTIYITADADNPCYRYFEIPHGHCSLGTRAVRDGSLTRDSPSF